MADNEVNITIKATDQASVAIKGVGGQLQGLFKIAQNQALREVGKDLQQYFNGALSSIQVVVTEYANYADQVRNFGRLTGAGAEESSRLIQVGDDLKISYEEMSAALQAAVRKGINPSVDSIANLSDQYMRLQPGLERSKFLMDNFGRSGMSMAEMMEQGGTGIRAMSASIEKSLVLTQQQVVEMRQAEMVMDNYNDQVQAVKLSIGRDLVGAFMQLPEPMKNMVLGLNAFGPQISNTIGLVFQLTETVNNFSILFKAGGLLSGIPGMAKSIGTALIGLGVAAGPIILLAGAIGLLLFTIEKLGPQALTTLKQLAGIAVFNATGQMPNWAMQTVAPSRDTGGRVQALHPYSVGIPELFVPDQPGTMVPMDSVRGGGNTYVSLTYAPAFSTVDADELQNRLQPFIERGVRRSR